MRRGDDAHVDLGGLRGADGLERTLLQDSQELYLKVGTHVAYLVEEDRSAVGDREPAFTMFERIREGAFDMPEEFGLEEFLGNRAAVDGDQSAIRPAAVVVERARDQFFAGPALACDEDGALCVGDLFDKGQRASEADTLSNDAVEFMTRAELALQVAVFGFQPTVLDGLRDEPSNHVESILFEGFFEIPERTRLQGLERVLRRVVPGHDDTGEVGLDFEDLPDEFEAVDAGHLNVAENEIDGFGRNLLESFGRVPRHQDFEARAMKNALDRAAIEFFVVDDEHAIFLQGDSPRSGGGAASVGEPRCIRQISASRDRLRPIR